MPLGCGPKRFLNWASILWAITYRPGVKWEVVLRELKVDRRTLERRFRSLADCTLSQATDNPAEVECRFREWADEVYQGSLSD